MKNKKKGFTLVELIVVLAILAILAAMLVPALTGYIDKANEKKIVATARQYAIAAQSVVSDAYADSVAITKIEATNGTVTVTTNPTGKGANYAEEFKKLSELKTGDVVQFVIDGTSHKIKGDGTKTSDGASYVTSGSLTAALDANGNWSLIK